MFFQLSDFVENKLVDTYKPAGRGAVRRATVSLNWQATGISQLLSVSQLAKL